MVLVTATGQVLPCEDAARDARLARRAGRALAIAPDLRGRQH